MPETVPDLLTVGFMSCAADDPIEIALDAIAPLPPAAATPAERYPPVPAMPAAAVLQPAAAVTPKARAPAANVAAATYVCPQFD